MTTNQLEKNIEKNKNIIQIVSLIITILIFITTVVSFSANLNNEIKNNKINIEKLDQKTENINKKINIETKEINKNKVDYEIFEMLNDRLDRIEKKLDQIQATQ